MNAPLPNEEYPEVAPLTWILYNYGTGYAYSQVLSARYDMNGKQWYYSVTNPQDPSKYALVKSGDVIETMSPWKER